MCWSCVPKSNIHNKSENTTMHLVCLFVVCVRVLVSFCCCPFQLVATLQQQHKFHFRFAQHPQLLEHYNTRTVAAAASYTQISFVFYLI